MTARQISERKAQTRRAVGALAGLLRRRGSSKGSREIVLHEASPEIADGQIILLAASREGKVARGLRLPGPVGAEELELGLAIAARMLEGRRRPAEPLSAHEAEVLRRGGFSLPGRTARPALTEGAIEYGHLLRTSLTPAQVAERLHVNSSRIRQRLGARELYGVKDAKGWKLPAFQFDEGGLVPHIERVLPALPRSLHPVAVARWFATPNADLTEGEREKSVSPRNWLLEGRDPAPVAALAAQL